MRSFKRNWILYVMLILPVVYLILFHYAPMFGLQVAFKDYRAKDGIGGSEWVGLQHFQDFFSNYKWKSLLNNTLAISLYSIFVGFPVPVILALLIHVSEKPLLKKFTQNISYVPYFISTVVMVGIINQILNPFTGLYGTICNMLGVTGATDIRSDPDTFLHLYVWSDIWQYMGWDSIIYVAALSSVPMELHEAAEIDGASRWRRVLAVDLPAIAPTICIMLIMRFGAVMAVGHEKVYLLQNALNISNSEIIATYVYKYGIGNNNFSYGTAIGLMNSAINTLMVIVVNWITKKISGGEQGLF